MDGIFIPDEIKTLKTINLAEKVLLSIYWYYTNGKLKCCKKTNEDIYNELMVSKNTFHRMKTHLKELGYIRTDGGIRVYYLGVENKMTESDTEEQITEEVEEPTETDIEPVEEKVEEKVKKTESTENEEVDEIDNKTNNKIDNKKDIVMEKSNVERIIDTLGDFYKTPEKLKYFYDKKQEWVDKINQADYKELSISTCASQIKLVINKKFGYPEVAAIPNTNKKEVKSEEFESCFM